MDFGDQNTFIIVDIIIIIDIYVEWLGVDRLLRST
jgi:hypothetical protein